MAEPDGRSFGNDLIEQQSEQQGRQECDGGIGSYRIVQGSVKQSQETNNGRWKEGRQRCPDYTLPRLLDSVVIQKDASVVRGRTTCTCTCSFLLFFLHLDSLLFLSTCWKQSSVVALWINQRPPSTNEAVSVLPFLRRVWCSKSNKKHQQPKQALSAQVPGSVFAKYKQTKQANQTSKPNKQTKGSTTTTMAELPTTTPATSSSHTATTNPLSTTSASSSHRGRRVRRRRVFSIGGRRIRCTQQTVLDWCVDTAAFVVEKVVYLLGPILICLALSIIGLMSYSFFGILVPMLKLKHANNLWRVYLHSTWVIWLVFNILFNYACCVFTKHNDNTYQTVLRQLATASRLEYPETTEAMQLYKNRISELLTSRLRASNNNNVRTWQLLGPFEWGYCSYTHTPKPPRSHYDHVSQQLILNLDHYCPWMFNASTYCIFIHFIRSFIYSCLRLCCMDGLVVLCQQHFANTLTRTQSAT